MGADFGSCNPIALENGVGNNCPAVTLTQEEQDDSLLIEQKIIGGAMGSIAGLSLDSDRIQSLTLERIREASAADTVVKRMVELVTRGCPTIKRTGQKKQECSTHTEIA